MTNKFKRVSEQVIDPRYEEFLVPDNQKKVDRYAYLKRSNITRKAQIAKDLILKDDVISSNNNFDYQKALNVTEYEDAMEERQKNKNYKTASQIIRRSEYYTENPVKEYQPPINAFRWKDPEKDNYHAYLTKNCSIFGTDLEEIEETLKQNAIEDAKNKFTNMQKREAMLEQRHKQWEQEQLNAIRPYKTLAVRASSILRNSNNETDTHNHNFGVVNYKELEEREYRLADMKKRKMEEKYAIAPQGKDKTKEWEENLKLEAEVYGQHTPEWIQKFMDEYSI